MSLGNADLTVTCGHKECRRRWCFELYFENYRRASDARVERKLEADGWIAEGDRHYCCEHAGLVDSPSTGQESARAMTSEGHKGDLGPFEALEQEHGDELVGALTGALLTGCRIGLAIVLVAALGVALLELYG